MIRTRFAPSPTGKVHVGSLRTALYNYLFAKSKGGKFVLRIEDTDVARSKKEFENEIAEALDWLGCHPDEDFSKGGPHGPYRQSERLHIYGEYFERLKNSGAILYRCFCSEDELAEMKKKQQEQGQRTGYDGRCYFKPQEEVEKLLKQGKEFSYRLKLPAKKIVFEDMLKGSVQIDLSSLSDPVIVRSDGTFTYHFCVVVDDIEMKITHVIRGEDHLVNTGYHLLLYSYFEKEPPRFAHVPLMHDLQGKKLSKRSGGASYKELVEIGVLPEALISYLLSTGQSREVVFRSIEEAVKSFTLEMIPRGKTVYDFKRLLGLNARLLQMLSEEEILKRAASLEFCNPSDLIERDRTLNWIRIWKENLTTLKDAGDVIKILNCEKIDYAGADLLMVTPEDLGVIEEATSGFEVLPQAVDIMDRVVELGRKRGISKARLLKILRIATTGRLNGPPLALVLRTLGPASTVQRLKYFSEKVRERW